MVISHIHRYLFVELPYSASTTISEELCEMYGGTRILYKHAKYIEFLRIASREEKQFFVFSCIRNPLGEAPSHYFRYKTNHDQMYTDPEKRVRYGITGGELRMYHWIQSANPGFPEFMRRAYRIPYDNWSTLSHREFDFLIRFENLQADFQEGLGRLGLEVLRPLPRRNATRDKEPDYLTYYSPEVIPHAKRIFGHFMSEWGYKFPPEWGTFSPTMWDDVEFAAWRFARTMYWRYANRTSNKAIRALGVRVKERVNP
jgi:hypothetical protein